MDVTTLPLRNALNGMVATIEQHHQKHGPGIFAVQGFLVGRQRCFQDQLVPGGLHERVVYGIAGALPTSMTEMFLMFFLEIR